MAWVLLVFMGGFGSVDAVQVSTESRALCEAARAILVESGARPEWVHCLQVRP